MSRICSPTIVGTSYRSLICQDTMALKALYRGLDNLSIESQEGALFYAKEVIVLLSSVQKAITDLFNKVKDINITRSNSGLLSSDNISEESFTGLGLYKRYKLLKEDLYKTKKYTDEIIFCLRRNKLLSESSSLSYLSQLISVELSQELECQKFLNGLINLYETDGLRISCSEFIDRLKVLEPKDELIQSTSIPWSIYCAINMYLMGKWRRSKRIFNTDSLWLDYITTSYLENKSNNSIPIKGLITSLPYTTFAIQIKVDPGYYTVLIDYDVKTGLLSCGGYVGTIEKDDSLGSYFTILDLNRTFDDVIRNSTFYSVIDATSYGTVISPSVSRWSIYDFKTDIYKGNAGFKDDIPCTYIPSENVGRYLKQSIVKPVTMSGKDLHDNSIDVFDWLMKIILTFTIFLSAENFSSFIHLEKPKAVVNRERLKKRNKLPAIENYVVAEREVALLKSGGYSSGEGKSMGKGRAKKSHIRRGHWHHYWVGKRDSNERKLIVKFLMPVIVNGDEVSDITKTSLTKN